MDQNLISTEKKTIEINEVDDMGEYFFHHLLNLFSLESSDDVPIWMGGRQTIFTFR